MANAPAKRSRGKPKKVSNKSDDVIQNNAYTPYGPFGANDPSQFGVGGGFNLSYPPGPFGTYGEQISNVQTQFKNLRWYFISNMRNLLSEMYVEIGLVQKIVNLPVDDGLRGGIEIVSKQLDEDQLALLAGSLDRDDDINTAGWAEKWARLYGGAGIIILTDQDPDEPFDLESVGPDTPLEFRAVDMWEIFWDKQLTEGWDPSEESEDFEFYSYYGVQLHKSRVMRIKGMLAPSFLRPRLRGWGFSVCEALVRPLNQYLKATDVTFEVTDEFKIDIYKIKNYVNTLMSPQGQTAVNRRIQYANYQKNYQNALVLDTEDEWDHKQLSFAGLAEMAADNRIQIASELGMPLTKIFGISAAGFNSGEDDIEVYNSMIESSVRNKLKYPLLRLCEIKCKKLFGFVPDDLEISFKPLRMLSSEQEENVKNSKFARITQALSLGIISPQQAIDSANKDNLFGIKIENENQIEGGFMDDEVGEGVNNPYDPQDVDNPGAARIDTRRSLASEPGGANVEPPRPNPPQQGDGTGEPRDIAKAPKRERDEFGVTKNSSRYDKASYEADGGDKWIDSRRLSFYDDPADKGAYAAALSESRDIYPGGNVKFAIWKYLKEGHKFSFNDTEKNMENEDVITKWIREKADKEYTPPRSSTAGIRGSMSSHDNKMSNPGKVDEPKWEKAKEAVKKEYGKEKWPVVSAVYQKMGGHFSKKK